MGRPLQVVRCRCCRLTPRSGKGFGQIFRLKTAAANPEDRHQPNLFVVIQLIDKAIKFILGPVKLACENDHFGNFISGDW